MEYVQPLKLQSTLSSSTFDDPSSVLPHHPIICTGDLRYEEDGTFRCPHAAAGPEDRRTRHALNQSIAILLLEIANLKLG